MTRDKIRSQADERMKKSIHSLQDEFKTLRGSRASQSLFEKIRVDYYGNKVPLNQVATLSIPEARLVIIQPWDRSVLPEIEKAIQKSELSVNPNNDGKVIRINIPPLTEDRRKELVKLTKNTADARTDPGHGVRATRRAVPGWRSSHWAKRPRHGRGPRRGRPPSPRR